MTDLIKVCSGRKFDVMMTGQVERHLKKADRQQLARCQKWMQKFCDDGFEFLTNEQLKFEGKFSTGDKRGTQLSVYAFKAWQLRAYGCVIGNRFVVTEVDIAKKQNEADRDKLEAAARKMADYI
ncbi:hypothetical protein E2F50_13225 [Rhizobium deserti]|uniref:Type II toxin-antitoxin system RelE/ParE family toxin n=1 Tax=Rhizobium deserti TaxID=2547961 RepID=A0A4R5UGZ5_9HYPH|nr:hypothetical protein [Rhizobium deserti]TDK35214.1 hypothetical protein E2F50_13225 [Rhizobium deserti]